MKPMRALAMLATLVLTACGSGGVQSPDFTSELVGLRAENPTTHLQTASVATGRTLQLVAIGQFTTPPGDEETESTSLVSADWTSSNTSVATVDDDGLVRAVSPGAASITATRGDFSSEVAVTVSAPELDNLIITREPDSTQTSITADSIPAGGQRTYRAVGIYSDGVKRSVAASWTTSDATVANPTSPATPTSQTKTVQVPQAAVIGATADIRASAVGASGTVFAVLNVTVSGAELVELSTVTITPSVIPVDLTATAVAMGLYSDNTSAQLPNSQVDWTSSNAAVATVDAAGEVTGEGAGTAVIKATLKAGTESQVTNPDLREAEATISVTGSACTAPMETTAFEAADSVSASCVACSVSDVENVVDVESTPTTFAEMSISFALMGSVSIDVTPTADITPFPVGNRVGFVVGRSSSSALAEMSTVSVSTLLDGVVQESSDLASTTELTLLGLIPLTSNSDVPSTAAAISFVATMPFDGLRITYDSGPLTTVGALEVYQACSGITLPPASP